MPDQFVVPQFLDAEDKIIGPISMRQFVTMLVVFFILFIMFRLLPFVYFLVVGIPFLAAGLVVAFVKINGQPFHYFFLNILQTFKRPRLRIWDRKYNIAELKEFIAKKEEPPVPPPPKKKLGSSSRLQELSLVVNTGGVYQPEGEL